MAKDIRPGERLSVIASMVTPGACVIDVGTDHAYLPAYLILNGTADKAKASDIRIGPLRRAEATRRAFHLEDRLQLRLCPGLRDFSAKDGDTVIIAGMGGETIAAILEDAPWTKDGNHRLLLQPMTSGDSLRGYLFSNGYEIVDEALAKEQGKLYTVLDVMGGGKISPHEPFELYASRHLIRDALAGEYLDLCITRLQKRRDGLLRARTVLREEISFVFEAIGQIEELKREWEECQV